MAQSKLTRNQKMKLPRRPIETDYGTYLVYPTIRYDDECGNGHNTFAITCTITDTREIWVDRGCCHEEFAQAYPELAHLVKWHLCSSDGPMYYIENTLYHASNSKSSKYKVGEPNRWDKILKFKDSNITHKFSKAFIEYLETHKRKRYTVVEVPHEKTTGYQYSPKYTFKGFNCKWYECPFDTKDKAIEYMKELTSKEWDIIEIVTGYQEGKERDFKAARNSAIWEDATDEQLSQDSEVLKEMLLQRLPKLMEEFRKDVESLGFTY